MVHERMGTCGPQSEEEPDSIHSLRHPVIGEILGITGWDHPSVCKSNQLQVDILRFSCINVGYIL